MDMLLQVGLSNAVVALILALIAVVVGFCCRRPAVVHGLWLLVLLKLVTPPLVRVPLPWPMTGSSVATRTDAEPSGEPLPIDVQIVAGVNQALADANPAKTEEAPVAAPEAPMPVVATSPWWPMPLLGVWLAGAGVWFGLAAYRMRRFHLLLRHAAPASSPLRLKARGLARKLGLGDGPEVWLVPGRLPPMLWSAFGPTRLLLPRDLPELIDEKQLETLLLHELAHLRRRDHWVRYLEFFALGIYWWHPVAWFARRELREAEEQCCDAWVMATLPNSGRSYSLALLETLDFLSEPCAALPVLASGVGPVADLKRRLRMILSGTTPRNLGWRGTLTLLGLGAILLPALPAWAFDETKVETKDDIQIIVKDGELDALKARLDLMKEALDAKQIEAEAVSRKLRQVQAKLELEGKAKALDAKLEEIKSNPTDPYAVKRLQAEYEALRVAKVAELDKIRSEETTDRWAAKALAATGETKKSALFARYATAASGSKKVLLLEKDGKTVLELPATWVVAERNGRLIIEIPMSNSTAPKTANADEARIAELERSLKALMTELEKMRREMKEAKP